MRFAGGKSNTPAMNDSVSARDTGLDRLPPQPIVCSANRALDKRPYGGNRLECGGPGDPAHMGECGQEAADG